MSGHRVLGLGFRVYGGAGCRQHVQEVEDMDAFEDPDDVDQEEVGVKDPGLMMSDVCVGSF